jgi:hypothetical protein
MRYIITGKTIEHKRHVTPEEFAHFLRRGIVLHIDAFNRLGFKKKINSVKTDRKRSGVAIITSQSIKEVARILKFFPSWFKVNWKIIPLE